MKVLIVDDTVSNIDVIAENLENDQDPYEIFVALNGEEAIEVLKEECVDIILLDIMMPVLDGFQTCSIIKENDKLKDIPVIFLTANIDEESVKKGYAVGGVDYIRKPFFASELLTKIKNYIQLSKYNNHLENIIEEKTIELQRKNEELLYSIKYDQLTGLENNISFIDEINALEEQKVIYLLDIDNFNVVNKLYGFEEGNNLLRSISVRLHQLLPSSVRVFKLKSDQFAFLGDETSRDKIEQTCQSLISFFDTYDFTIATESLRLSFSIGISIFKNPEALIEAEYALNIAKSLGKRNYFIYDENSSYIRNEQDMIQYLNKTREYILNDKIEPFFQPIVEVSSKKVVKFEALARVIDNGEIITPNVFLPSANKLGLITSITKIIINKTIKKFSGTDYSFSINVTERDLSENYLVNFLTQKCAKYNIKHNQITLEILENITISESRDLITKQIQEFKENDFLVAIDDFGSENANLSRILNLKTDYIKIDGLFVKEIDTDVDKEKVVRAVVELAKKMGIKTVAEFVSSESVFEKIKECGVDYAQGYYFGKPVQHPLELES